MTRNPFVNKIITITSELGLEGLNLLSHEYDEHNFGNSVAIFQGRSLLLRFLRDRGQEFLDIAALKYPDRYYQFDDIECAMGWKTLAEVLSKQEPEQLEDVLARVKKNIVMLENAFSEEKVESTITLLDRQVKEHSDMVMRTYKSNHWGK